MCTIFCTLIPNIAQLTVLVKRKEDIFTTNREVAANYAKEIRHRLIDRGMTQKQLCKEVSEKTGLKLDSCYMAKIMAGTRHPPKIIQAINEILEIEDDKATPKSCT